MENLTNLANEKTAHCGMPEVFQLIEALQKRFAKFQAYILKAAHLTLPQYYILTLLSARDGRPFKELADELVCTRATVTGIVDTLEKKGLVVRAPHPEDRRSMLVKLTEEGRTLLQATPGVEEALGGCCCEALPEDETLELIRLLRKLSLSLPF
jgi:DNA-binding MarR family transcriptional regulator